MKTGAVLVVLVVGAVVLMVRRRSVHTAGSSYTLRDYTRAAFYAWFPFGPSPASISAQLLRWAVTEQMPITSDRSLSPCGVTFGLTAQEHRALASRVPALEFAIAEAILQAAEANGRRLVSPSPWVTIRPDLAARPGLPTIEACYDVSQERGARVSPEPSDRPRWGRAPFASPIPTSTRRSASEDLWGAATTVARSGDAPGGSSETVDARHRLDGADHSWALAGTMVAGRGHGADVELLHPQVSRRHATVQVVGAAAYLEDLGPFNGTFVDGIKITGAVALQDGNVIRLGPLGPALTYRCTC